MAAEGGSGSMLRIAEQLGIFFAGLVTEEVLGRPSAHLADPHRLS